MAIYTLCLLRVGTLAALVHTISQWTIQSKRIRGDFSSQVQVESHHTVGYKSDFCSKLQRDIGKKVEDKIKKGFHFLKLMF